MQSILDPSTWAGLLTLILLEIILNIDNLVFIAILADKLPPKKRDKAIFIGLSLALIMRLILLTLISWMVTLTKPILNIGQFIFSARDVILLIGGIFLLFKATVELHERLENCKTTNNNTRNNYAIFWVVIMQIAVLDTLFSLDAVITAVGMVNYLPTMILSLIIAMILMLLASKILTKFINSHPTVVVLCLSFLLMIGLSLIAEGFGFHIPKTYLYVTIGFSIIIELFNQIALRNFIKNQTKITMRERTADTILRLMQRKNNIKKKIKLKQIPVIEIISKDNFYDSKENNLYYKDNNFKLSWDSECYNIMTYWKKIFWIDLNKSDAEIKTILLKNKYNFLPICYKKLNNIIGVVESKKLLINITNHKQILNLAKKNPPIMIPENLKIIHLFNIFYKTKNHFFIITNKNNDVKGIITTTNIIEIIFNLLNYQKDIPELISINNGWLVNGNINLQILQKSINYFNLTQNLHKRSSFTLSEFLIKYLNRFPKLGEIININSLSFRIIVIINNNVDYVHIIKKTFTHE